MNNSEPAWQQFEILVQKILEANNFSIQIYSPRGDIGFDLLGEIANERWAIEVKFYRTSRVRPSLIESAAARVVNNGIKQDADKGMLVISSILSPEIRMTLEQKYSVVFVDRVDLRMYASRKPELLDELDVILELDPEFVEAKESKEKSIKDLGEKLGKKPRPIIDTKGTELCNQLSAVKRGKVGWAEYEKICVEILKYLFPNDLEGWHKQKSTDGGANRYDFVCRVRPVTEFWKFLVENLNSRYIVFEFKNYTGKIKQGQVLTTEKYLLERGLRKVAIMFTRVGADKNAIGMMQGAMREHGKLILYIDDETVCKMLHMKESGEDPTDLLFELTDNFLLSLPR